MPASRLTSLFVVSGAFASILVGSVSGMGFEARPSPAQAVADRGLGGSLRTDSLLAAVTFDSVWSRVRSTHFDPDMGGVDWDAVRAELRPEALSATTNDELRAVLAEMLGRLGESHFGILPGASAPAFDGAASTDEVGAAEPGFDVRWVEEMALVTRVGKGSPAEASGVRPGWIVDEIAGIRVDSLAGLIRDGSEMGARGRRLAVWLPAALRNRLRGPEGSLVQVSFRDDRGGERDVRLRRAAPPGDPVRFGNLPPIPLEVEWRVQPLERGLRVGVMRFTAWFPAAVPAISEAMDDLRDVDAMVIDLRGNPGGVGALVMGVGGHFLDEPISLGTMRTRETSLDFVANPQRVTSDGRRTIPYGGPLLILVDPLTASTSEIFAGGLQAIGRATVVGETTAGQALPALVVPLPNGDLLMHAVADFTEPDGTRIEGRGVQPDVPVIPDRSALLEGRDPVLQEALQWILDSLP